CWETREIRLSGGRAFKHQDDERAPKVVVVNQSFASKFFPNESPIGKRFTLDVKKPDEIEIVGLVKDAKYARQRDHAPPTMYLPWRQAATVMPEPTFDLPATADPRPLIASLPHP